MPYTTINGAKHWYEIRGKGEPMALIGSFGLGRENLDPVIPLLEKHYTLLNWDMRGFGKSDVSGMDDVAIETLADDLVALMEGIGWNEAHIHGTNLGGAVALAAGIRHPKRCTTIVANCFIAKPDVAYQLRLEGSSHHLEVSGGWNRSVAAHIAANVMDPKFLNENPDFVETTLLPELSRTPPQVRLAYARAMLHTDLQPDDLSRLDVPVLIIAGERDRATPIDLPSSGRSMRDVYDLLPNCDFVILKDIGHLSIFEAPERYTKAIVDFIDGVRAGRPSEKRQVLL